MKKQPYRIVAEESTASSRALADWLAKDGQLLIPLVELMEKGERSIDEVIDVMTRATVEVVLQMSAEQVAGPKAQGGSAVRLGRCTGMGCKGDGPTVTKP